MDHDKINSGVLEKGDVTEGESTTFTDQGSVINASGHTDQLTRQYGLVGLTGIAVTVNNAWVVLGSSISVSILSGGISGVIYGLMVAVFYYTFIGFSIAEVRPVLPDCPEPANLYAAFLLMSKLRRSISLGYYSSRSKMGPDHRLLCRVDQLLWLDVWASIFSPSCSQCWSAVLRNTHTYLFPISMARLRRISDRHMAERICRHLLQSTCALYPETWSISCRRRWSRDYHYCRRHAVEACIESIRLELVSRKQLDGLE